MGADRRTYRGETRGFTLIEIVLVMLLIGVLATVLIHPFRQGVQSFVAVRTHGDLSARARDATTRMIREIRNIQKEADNTANISSAYASTITFTDVQDNAITFALSGNTVQRNSNALVDQVSSLQFQYFNGSNAALTSLPLNEDDRKAVRRIRVVMTLQEGGQTITVTGEAFLRDLTGN